MALVILKMLSLSIEMLLLLQHNFLKNKLYPNVEARCEICYLNWTVTPLTSGLISLSLQSIHFLKKGRKDFKKCWNQWTSSWHQMNIFLLGFVCSPINDLLFEMTIDVESD